MHLFGYFAFTDAFGIDRIKRFRWLWSVYGEIIEDQSCDLSFWAETPWYDDDETKEEAKGEDPEEAIPN